MVKYRKICLSNGIARPGLHMHEKVISFSYRYEGKGLEAINPKAVNCQFQSDLMMLSNWNFQEYMYISKYELIIKSPGWATLCFCDDTGYGSLSFVCYRNVFNPKKFILDIHNIYGCSKLCTWSLLTPGQKWGHQRSRPTFQLRCNNSRTVSPIATKLATNIALG